MAPQSAGGSAGSGRLNASGFFCLAPAGFSPQLSKGDNIQGRLHSLFWQYDETAQRQGAPSTLGNRCFSLLGFGIPLLRSDARKSRENSE
jgi:hypothetical protein